MYHLKQFTIDKSGKIVGFHKKNENHYHIIDSTEGVEHPIERKGWNSLCLNFEVYLKKHYSCIKIQANWRGYNFRKKNVLEPCYINELDIDTQTLIECLKKDYLTNGRMEYYKSTSTQNLNLEDGFMEFITAKCINGDRVGEGHCPIDVIKDHKGIDVLCVCLNGMQTNEKSIMQNFSKCGNNLDTLFDNGKYQEALYLFTKEYYKKLFNVKKTKNVQKLYYLAFISTDINVYMSVFKINLDCILNIKYENITKQKKSIKFKGFIDDKFGITTLFKSKKRLEIRLNKEILNCYNTIRLI
jgi:hypothetical protein